MEYQVTCEECGETTTRGVGKGMPPQHKPGCSKAVRTHRMRRGKLVEIPEKWRGVVTYKQTKNKRQPVNRRTRKGP